MDTATHEIYTDCHSLALHAALPISGRRWADPCRKQPNWTASPCRACGREAQVSIASAERNRATTPPAAALRRPGGVTTTPLGRLHMVSEASDRNSRPRSEEQRSELQSLMLISYAVSCLTQLSCATNSERSQAA